MTKQLNRSFGRLALLVGALAAGSALTACSNDDSDPGAATQEPATVSITIPSPTSAQVPNPDQITAEAAQQLCDMMRADIGTWRDQGATVAKVTFNGTVHNWAARNGGLNDVVVTDRGSIDAVTTQNCPDVRQQAVEALDVPDLASALAGFGR
ncbi:hypothetical protein [Nocardia barduliensis]|uniref:hypothetical protein n=1 Tax=Nocardia barduliensis TaxID=2736643 RepID=UPI001572DCE9|nr:hypothetical protein [Nocardia barduliensis]